MSKKTKKKMRGMTLISMLLIVIVIIFSVVITINLVPPYLHHFAVVDSLEDLAKDPDITHLSKERLRNLLIKKFSVNYVRDVSPDGLVMSKQDGRTLLQMKYEIRVHLIANIDAVIMFDDQVYVRENDKS